MVIHDDLIMVIYDIYIYIFYLFIYLFICICRKILQKIMLQKIMFSRSIDLISSEIGMLLDQLVGTGWWLGHPSEK